MKQLMETGIPDNFSMGLQTEKQLRVGATHTYKVADVLFTGVSNILKMSKSTEQPVAFVFGDFTDDFIAAAIVSYHENEEPDKPGNWSYVWTFDKEDVPAENTKIVTCKDAGVYQGISGYGGTKWHMTFKDTDVMAIVFNYLLKTIKNYLISNATVEAETAIELEGIFQARSAIEENNEVVCSIEVVGETKAIIKSDEDIEK